MRICGSSVGIGAAIGLIGVPGDAAELHVGSGRPHPTVQAAIDLAAPGDSVIVHAGSYSEELALASSGTEAAPITMTAAGDGDVTIAGSVAIEGDFWEISDLTFVPPGGVDGIEVRGNGIVLRRIELSGGTRDGIDGGGIGNQVIDSTIHNFDGGSADAHCIVLNPGAEDWTIRGNELFDCSGDTIQLYADGFERTIKNIVIADNHMHFTGALARTENAIDVKNGDGLTITGNVMHGFPDNKTVVFQKGPANIALRCNVLFDGFTGIEFRQEDGGTVENVELARNLMYGFSSYALMFDGTTNAAVVNNTFVDIGSDGLRIELAGLDGGTVRNNLWLRTGNLDAGNFDADHNAFFDTGAVDIASASDVNADPLLDDEFRPVADSPLVDAGVDVGLPFAGEGPDIGWHEQLIDACEGSGGEPSGGEPSGAGGSHGSTTSASASGAGGGAASPAIEEGGCGCRMAPRSRGFGWLALAGVGVLVTRRGFGRRPIGSWRHHGQGFARRQP